MLVGTNVAGALPDCANLLTFNCSDPLAQCRSAVGFTFEMLANVTLAYWQQCPDGPWLFRLPGQDGPVTASQARLTENACEAIAGPSWTRYPTGDIWNRLTTWKFPLFQLIANSPRPPLGWWEEGFTIVHLLGDPIGSFQDLIRKLASCQDRVDYWRRELKLGSRSDTGFSNKSSWHVLQAQKELDDSCQQPLWRALALIVTSYDEWGAEVGDVAEAQITQKLNRATDVEMKDFITLCINCAKELAADRTTKFLPVMVAQGFFIGSVVIAIVRTKSYAEGPSPSAYINIETFSIGFTALYFWIIALVTIISIIGTSQTASTIPRILESFQNAALPGIPAACLSVRNFATVSATMLPFHDDRYRSGGIYAWQPEAMPKFILWRTESEVWSKWRLFWTIIPFLSVSCGTITGIVLTSFVPPDGWSCRSFAELAIFLTWIASFVLTFIGWSNRRFRFWFTFAKDFVAMGVTLGLIVATQIGIFNKCACYTAWGAVGLAEPENPEINAMLQHRISLQYPAIAVVGIVTQLIVFPGVVVTKYKRAVAVFMQRDDGQSNFEPIHSLWQFFSTTSSQSDPEQQANAAGAEDRKIVALCGKDCAPGQDHPAVPRMTPRAMTWT